MITRDEIIKMAREAGGLDITSHGWTSWVGTQSQEFLERFFRAVYAAGAAAEREACAKVCDDWPNGRDDVYSIGAAIRARSEK